VIASNRVSARVLALVAPVTVSGVSAICWAAVSYVTARHSAADVAAVVGMLLGNVFAERFPVPVEGTDAGGVTLGFVFAVAAILLFGWEAGVLIAGGGPAITQLIARRPPIRVTYNASMFALAALAGGLAVAPVQDGSVVRLLTRLVICAFVYNLVNLALVSAVLAVSSGKSFATLFVENLRRTTAPFALMASAALTLVVLWERSPALSVALIGPLLAIGLYQRSTFKVLRAMRLALTDPLTGLGNHRHFHERLQCELGRAEQNGTPLSLCLVDVDDFKRINDRYGHPVGDRVLGQVAARLRQGGEAFRLGGDEFAVLLPNLDQGAGIAVARSIVDRIATVETDGVGSVTASAGVAALPAQGVSRDELIRLADSALYWAKEEGKNRVRAFRPATALDPAPDEQPAEERGHAARYRAAVSLAQAVDARDVYTGSHSQRVGDLSARIARRLGVDEPLIELTRLAGSLHDVGKLAIPEEILQKPGALDESERLALQRYPQVGSTILEGLGVDRIADWVLHHHERWDGGGYPDRLHGEEIPLGARIIFVADAFDAMTSGRGYREALSDRDAVVELERCAGSQFDPAVVGAFSEVLGLEPEPVALLAS
jgi:diguanylate cyclase (GGDEF)-like protein